eukprot:Skav212319  [mRNA]  locus=scaffold3374:128661:129242:- [translate_table: standard]
MKCALRTGNVICIHSDLQFVVDGLLFLRFRKYIPKHWRRQQRWVDLRDTVRQLADSQWWIHKVHFHSDFSAAEDSLEEWWILGSQKADSAVLRANQDRSSEFWNAYHSMCACHDRHSDAVARQLQFLVHMAKFDFKYGVPEQSDLEDVSVGSLVIQRFPKKGQFFSQFECDAVQEMSAVTSSVFPAQFLKQLL